MRRLLVGLPLAAVAVLVVVVATQHGPKQNQPVLVILDHATVGSGVIDGIEAVNDSRYQVGMTSCGILVTPRTSTGFTGGPGRDCGDYDTLAPHSRQFEGDGSWTPGKYWVWFGYRRLGEHTVELAYARLTVRGPLPTYISLHLAHSTVQKDALVSVDAANTSSYRVQTTGANIIPRTSARLVLPKNYATVWDVPGNELAPHSRHRFSAVRIPNAPGNYWVMTYWTLTGSTSTFLAYTKLTVRNT